MIEPIGRRALLGLAPVTGGSAPRPPLPPFDEAERAERYGRATRLMEQMGLTALLVGSISHESEASDYLVGPIGASSFPVICVPLNGQPMAYAPPDVNAVLPALMIFGAESMGGKPWISHWRFGPDGFEALADDMRKAGLTTGRIGAVNIVGYPAGDYLTKALPGVELVPVEAEFTRARAVLTPTAQAVVTAAAHSAEAAAQAFIMGARPGADHARLSRAVREAALLSGASCPDVALGLPNGLPSRHRPMYLRESYYLGRTYDAGWRQDGAPPPKIKNGDVLTLEAQTWIGVLQARVQATVAVGPQPAERRRLFAAAEAAYQAGLAAVAPGRTPADITAAMTTALPPGAAFAQPPVRALNPEWPVEAGAPEPLQPGMHLHLRPLVGIGGVYVALGGGVLVQAAGPQELNPLASRVHLLAGKPS